MPANSKRGSPTWKQLLLLIVLGAGVGYPCFENLPIWGSGSPLYIVGFFVGAVAFISGLVGFFAIALKGVTSATERIPANTQPHALATSPGNTVAALARLRVAVIAVIALVCFDVLHRGGGPSLASGYGRAYWIQVVVTLLLSQLPYAIGLIRIRRVADPAGLALIMAAPIVQGFFILWVGLLYHPAHQISVAWPWLTISLGLVAAILAGLAWRSTPLREGQMGLLLSVFFGFAAYTILSKIVLAVLRVQLRKLY